MFCSAWDNEGTLRAEKLRDIEKLLAEEVERVRSSILVLVTLDRMGLK